MREATQQTGVPCEQAVILTQEREELKEKCKQGRSTQPQSTSNRRMTEEEDKFDKDFDKG